MNRHPGHGARCAARAAACLAAALVIVGATLASGALAAATVVSDKAQHIAAAIDALDVEHRWPAGVHVDWESGLPDGKRIKLSAEHKHTHCSAFVASAAKTLGVYILRPPEHPAKLLANAQYEWLASAEGLASGWRAAADAEAAQQLANSGALVVAVYRNHKMDRPGHIAILRPSLKPATEIARDGPQITQAGAHNYRETNLREGFAGHPAAWGRQEVRFFAHAVDLAAIAAH